VKTRKGYARRRGGLAGLGRPATGRRAIHRGDRRTSTMHRRRRVAPAVAGSRPGGLPAWRSPSPPPWPPGPPRRPVTRTGVGRDRSKGPRSPDSSGLGRRRVTTEVRIPRRVDLADLAYLVARREVRSSPRAAGSTIRARSCLRVGPGRGIERRRLPRPRCRDDRRVPLRGFERRSIRPHLQMSRPRRGQACHEYRESGHRKRGRRAG